MERSIPLLLFIGLMFGFSAAYAQCDPPGLMPSSPLCTDAPSPCFPTLCYNTTKPIPFTPPNDDFCGPGSKIENPQYFSFLATATEVIFYLNVNCGKPGKDPIGLQVAIIEIDPDACEGWKAANVVECVTLNGNLVNITATVKAGQRYLLLFNGLNGSICNYYFIQTVGVETDAAINDVATGPIQGNLNVCPGSSVHLTLPWSHPNAYFYRWKYQNEGFPYIEVQPPAGEFPQVDIPIPKNTPEGDYSVCVYGYNFCDTTNEICATIKVRKLVTEPVKKVVCKEDLPYKYPGTTPQASFDLPGNYEIKFTTADGCDSIIDFELEVPLWDYNPNDNQYAGFVCSGLYTFPVNNKKYPPGLGHYIPLVSQESGCDSAIILSVMSPNPQAEIDTLGRLSCKNPQDTSVTLLGWEGVTSSYDPNVFSPPFDQFFPTFSYTWKDSLGKIIKDGPEGELRVTTPNKYKLIFKITIDGITCMDSTVFVVKREEFPPVEPILSGVSKVCQGSLNQTFTVTNPDSLFYTIQWILPPGASIQSNTADSVSVNVQFNPDAALGDQFVCAVVHTPCGKDTSCYPVTVESIPTGSINAVTDSVCLGSPVDLSFLLPATGTYDVVYNDGSGPDTLFDIASGQTLNVQPAVTTTYSLLSIESSASSTCPNTAPNSSVTITVSQPATAAVSSAFEVCNAPDPENTTPTNLDFRDLITGGNTGGTWINLDNPAGTTGSLPTLDFTGVMPGTYQFSYRLDNAEPCEDSVYTMSLTVRDCKCASVAVAPGVALCNDNDNIDLNTLKVTTEPGTWTILSNVTPAATLTGNTLDVTGAGAGTVSVQFKLDKTQPAGCDDVSVPVNIVVHKAPFINALQTAAEVCNTDPSNTGKTILNFGNFLGAGTDAGTWKDELGNTVPNPAAVDFDGETPGDVLIFTYTVTGQAPCTDKSINIEVTIKDCGCPDASTSAPGAALCTDDDILDLNTLKNNTNPGTWSIVTNVNPPAVLNGTNLNVSGAGAGSVVVRYTLDDIPAGCTGFTEQTITLRSKPSTSFLTLDTVVCNAIPADPNSGSPFLELLDLLTGGDQSGFWSISTNPGVPLSSSDLDFTGLTPGTKLTYIYTTGAAQVPCSNVTYQLNINVLDCDCPNQNTKAPSGELCNDSGELSLDNLLFSNTAPGSWSITSTPPAGTKPFAVIAGGNFEAGGAEAGVYQLTFTVNDPVSGCIDTSQQYITVEDLPYAGQPFEDKLCADESEIFDLFASLNDADAGGTWLEVSDKPSSGGAFDAAAGTFNSAGQAAGIYKFEYTVKGGDACPDDKAVVTININEAPVAEAGDDVTLTCDVSSIILGGNSSQGPDIVYAWKELSGKPVTDPSKATVQVSQSGDYELTVTNQTTGCSSTDLVNVKADNQVITAAPVDSTSPSCFQECDGFIKIDPAAITGGQPPFELSLNGGAFAQQFDFPDLCSGKYSIEIRDKSGCTFPIEIQLQSPPDVEVSLGSDKVILEDESVTVTPVISISQDQIASLVIVDDSGVEVCSGLACLELILQPEETTLYTITVTDKNGCSDTDDLVIAVANKQEVFIPSGFTPDGDGQNDVLVILGTELLIEKVNYFRIFNRWGSVVFSAENFQINDPKFGWDGKFNGEAVNPGVFIYVAEVRFLDGTVKQVSGDVTISGKAN